jgi:hypothetical protein
MHKQHPSRKTKGHVHIHHAKQKVTCTSITQNKRSRVPASRVKHAPPGAATPPAPLDDFHLNNMSRHATSKLQTPTCNRHLPPPTSHLPPPTSHLPPPTSHLPHTFPAVPPRNIPAPPRSPAASACLQSSSPPSPSAPTSCGTAYLHSLSSPAPYPALTQPDTISSARNPATLRQLAWQTGVAGARCTRALLSQN